MAANGIGAQMRERRGARARRDDGAKNKRLAVVLSLFLLLLAAAFLVGGHAAIDPLLQSAATREAKRIGDVVVSMPDGTFCRHLSFDNRTADLIEGAVEQCPGNLVKKRAHPAATSGFAWGAR